MKFVKIERTFKQDEVVLALAGVTVRLIAKTTDENEVIDIAVKIGEEQMMTDWCVKHLKQFKNEDEVKLFLEDKIREIFSFTGLVERSK